MIIAIIGAGAAGCFCAINLKRRIPHADIHIFEASPHPLAKVTVSGGGRCNLTNTFKDIVDLAHIYPRGHHFMKRALRTFSHNDTIAWFSKEGVKLKQQDDQRIFPVSDNAQEITGTLLRLMEEENIKLHLSHQVTQIDVTDDGYILSFSDIRQNKYHSSHLIITCGGITSSSMFQNLHLDINTPVPSLFAFDINEPSLTSLAGITIPHCIAGITGTRFRSEGAILITHRGMSGPCILTLSSYAAQWLADNKYKGRLFVDWTGGLMEQYVITWLNQCIANHPHKHIGSIHPEALASGIWNYLLLRCGIDKEAPYISLNTKQKNKITAVLRNDIYDIAGKCRNKGEFVTCGGIAFSNVNPVTLECRQHPRLYFAGEILDIDAVTGGFNLQAAWTSAYIVANSISF